MSEKKQTSDFRYETGETRVPWAAVGESIVGSDIMDVTEFLIRPKPEHEVEYRQKLEAIRDLVTEVESFGTYATKLSLGNKVSELESKCKDFLGVKHACFLTNATAGFEIGYKFADLQPGDEVIAPAITFIATIAYPLSIGAKLVFADLDPRTVNMDPDDVIAKISSRTKVIIPVHIGGYPTDMDPIIEVANDRGITVIEDAAHAFGGTYKGRMIGTIGHFGAYSFHEVKNVTSFGEGGLLVSNLDAGADFAKCRFLGLDFTTTIPNWLYDVTPVKNLRGNWFVGGNHSATEIQAVLLLSQLKRINRIIEARKKAFDYLNERFAEEDAIYLPMDDTPETKSTHHLYLLRINPERAGGNIQDLKGLLTKRGITQIPHFGPLYHFDVCRKMGYDKDAIAETCPHTEQIFNNEFTHLPLYPLSQDQLECLADQVLDAIREMKG